jgi:hypothetical protein
VSNSVQVPNLNASQVEGHVASDFLGANQTAVNSNQLGGVAASGFMQGGGTTTGGRKAITGPNTLTLIVGAGSFLIGDCDPLGTGSGAALYLSTGSGVNSGAWAQWWNKDGVGNANPLNNVYAVTPGNGSTAPYAVMVQVDNVNAVTTYSATARYDSSADTCHFIAQAVTTNG